MAEAEDAVARLDDRIAHSSIQEGWISRTHFVEAQALLDLEGHLVTIEDLVLHDSRMDIRLPSHELIQCHALLRARRRLTQLDVGVIDRTLLDAIAGRTSIAAVEATRECDTIFDEYSDDIQEYEPLEFDDDPDNDEALQAAAAITARTESLLRGAASDHFYPVYDQDWQEGARVREYLNVIAQTVDMPPTIAAVIAEDAWSVLMPFERAPGVGRLLAAAILKSRLKTTAHLALVGWGLKAIPYKERRDVSSAGRCIAGLKALTAGARAGAGMHSGWLAAKTLLENKLKGRRSSSKLPQLVNLLLSRPIVTVTVAANELGVSRRAAHDLIADLGLREVTGRGRYRAWSVM